MLSAVGVGLFGMALERFVVRRFYGDRLLLRRDLGREPDSEPGNASRPRTVHAVGAVAGMDHLLWRLLVWRLSDPSLAIALAVMFATWWVFYRTRIGVRTRATTQNPDMAQALGVDTRQIYLLTFRAGSALAGLDWRTLCPDDNHRSTHGYPIRRCSIHYCCDRRWCQSHHWAISSAALLAGISTPLSSILGTFIGRIGLLIAALVVIRSLPRGISGYWQDLRYRRMAGPPHDVARQDQSVA